MDYDEDFEWGNEPLQICACGQLLRAECEEYCISVHAAYYDRYSAEANAVESEELSNFDEEFISCGPRVGSLEDFDMDNVHVAEGIDPEHGDPYEDFPTLDLPDPGRAEVVDTYVHPDDHFIYMEVRRWPDGQQRHLLRSYK